ncbi:MAG: nucleotidyl transferase AbiEii/AbiGii toxin family protein [Pseudobdellovibrionaceae bacterium]
MDIRQTIEFFHLSFAHRLAAKVDRKFFCLKGGCNLRFYFQSIRYSEDIDFDVHTTSVETLKKNVSKILDDQSFHAVLKNSQNLEIVDWTDPKQTEATQRWKVSIKVGTQMPVPTKIEFSRRNPDVTGAEVAPVHPQLTSFYSLQPIILQHYQLLSAIEQKIGALINRTETQARDVIDLKILKDRLAKPTSFSLTRERKTKVLETLMSVSFDDFKSQVWPYLMTEYQEYYGQVETWSQLLDEVIKFIETQSQGEI